MSCSRRRESSSRHYCSDMLKVDPGTHNPDPSYLRSLIEQAGISQRLASRLTGVDPGNFRQMLRGRIKAPYSVQFVLEYLAAHPPQREDYDWS